MKRIVCLLLGLMLLFSAAAVGEESEKRLFMGGLDTVDLYGNKVDESIMEGYDLVVVNMWATYCGYCIQEMPDMGRLAEEWKDKGVLVLGMCCDLQYTSLEPDPVQLRLARSLVEDNGATTYTHLVPDEERLQNIYSLIQGYPAAILLNSKGEMLGEPVYGAIPYESWNEGLASVLTQLQSEETGV